MGPNPDDDLFIEPASDEDVVYADFNNTMDGGGSAVGQRAYIHLLAQLRNVTRDSGQEVRFKCEAAGTPPLTFSWLKNHAPIEKNRRTKVRNRESSSRLVISDLEVLDSGYYQCVVSNSVASVNTTAVLRVNNVVDKGLKPRKGGKLHTSDYDDYEMDRGRLPDEEDADLLSVGDNAAGPGYVPINSGHEERWLDRMKIRRGDCVPYEGEACRHFLAGRHITITSDNREDMYDIDRNLRAAMMFINSSPSVSAQCKQYSQAVACYHMYKVCDAKSSSGPHTICRKDCERLQTEICPDEFNLASQHELVGEGPKALFPKCATLAPTSTTCIPILEVPGFTTNGDRNLAAAEEKGHLTHWCYVDSGRFYAGTVSQTKSGHECLRWTASTSREYNVEKHPGLAHAENYCRNPGGHRTSPWCFAEPNGQEEYCDVPKCPKEMNMYPHLTETPPRETSTRSGTTVRGLGGGLAEMWESLTPQYQMALVGGGVFLAFLLLLCLCCACCCRSKRRKTGGGSNSSGGQKGGHQVTLQSCNGSSVVNSAANSAYYRKLNGTSTPILGGGGAGGGAGRFEMASLLPPGSQIPLPPNNNPPSYAPPTPAFFPQEPYRILDIPVQQLKILELVGEGQFGIVHTALWTGGTISGEPLQVAIKSLKPGSSNVERANFEEELKTVASFDHPHVIRLFGVCYVDGHQPSAVFEYMVHGDLHDFLRLRAPSGLDNGTYDPEQLSADNEDFLRIATQIAYGMEYLASMNYVHRDLATRNCLVGDQRVIKIADFGLMRSCYEKDYYKMQHRMWMPVRWMAKETLELGRFSEASDVWSFGVTLWEIYAYGRQPYETATNQQVMEMISTRHLLECPTGCPTNIYSMMVECWHEHPDRRPTFSELHSRLQAWVTSPAHSSLLQNVRPPTTANNGGSSHSGSSGRGAQQMPRPQLGNAAAGSMVRVPKIAGGYPAAAAVRGSSRRIGDDASPLMRRGEANYTYSEDDTADDSD